MLVTQMHPTPRTHQAPLSMGILPARILEWVPIPSPGDLPNPGIQPRSPALQADSLPSEPRGKPKLGDDKKKDETIWVDGGKKLHMNAFHL